ncbi:MAG: tyrosine-protein phosphatase [Dysgonamonadaceae bacterium]|jgi:protein-tyrosine phosphatase|nr:tyrosine-protein phosphatase [Dysgonamonadaceae bacterium]
MIKRAFLSLVCLGLFYSCTKEKPDIHTACELTATGTYVIKWETFPSMTGNVKIYESSKTDSFDLNSPIAEQNISIGYKNVLPMPTNKRSYFQLVFNKEYSVITADRIIPMQKIFNFRDLGGYQNRHKQQVQWGKLYRSGSLAMANKHDITTLKQLGIKTVIDFRTEKDTHLHPSQFQAEQIFNLPLRGNNYNVFFDEILSGKMQRHDVIMYLQEVFYFLLENNSDYFTKMFDVLLNEQNYPVMMYCSLGQDRSAIAVALALAALDIDQETIINDYLLSNELINYHSLVDNADNFTPQVQETITALFRAHRETISYSFNQIEQEYGSMQNYLEKELQMTGKKREKLKELLLYK